MRNIKKFANKYGYELENTELGLSINIDGHTFFIDKDPECKTVFKVYCNEITWGKRENYKVIIASLPNQYEIIRHINIQLSIHFDYDDMFEQTREFTGSM